MTEKPERIFVIGHMGAGKSLFAKVLAEKLGWQYVDANPSLERYIGRTLEEIMGKEGEAAFHRCEAEILAHYQKKSHVVVVLEEAVIATEENRKLLSDEYVVYLQVSVPTQLERMQEGDNPAPLLPIDDIETFLEQQHHERDALFEAAATLTIESISVNDDVDQAITALEDIKKHD